jgi:hypothetical protein
MAECQHCPHPEHFGFRCTQCGCRSSSIDIPELLRPSDFEYYRPMPQRPRSGWPRRDSLLDCRKSLDKAHENLRHLVRENDRLRAALIKMHERQRWIVKVSIALFTGSWGLFAAVLKLFLPALLRSIAK